MLYDRTQFDRFYSLLGSINYDGFSMPVRNLSMNEIAAFYIRLYQLGVKMVHLLGTTSFRNIALSAYFARQYFDWISLDATTWNHSARHVSYMNPFNLRQIKLLNLKLKDIYINQQCNCQWCKQIKNLNDLNSWSYKDKYAFLRGHNFYAIDKIFEDLFRASMSRVSLERELRKRACKTKWVNEISNTIQLVDMMINKDVNLFQYSCRAVMNS